MPSLATECGEGRGLAACPALGLLVTSDSYKNALSVWSLPGGASGNGASGGAGDAAGGGGGGLTVVCTLGPGLGCAAPMQFKFFDGQGYSGYLAFTPSTTASCGVSSNARPLLLVTDAGANAVHVVDVVGRSHAGYLAPPGTINGPRGVAASGTSPLVAVSAWKKYDSDDHVVVVYRGSGAVWEAARVIGGGFGRPGPRDGQLSMPYGLWFTRDGSAVCVADAGNGRASVFRVGDGGFVRHIAAGLNNPMDVEEVEGGWLVACLYSHTLEFVGDGISGDGGGRRPFLGKAGGRAGSGDGEFWFPSALAVVPGLGLVVRDSGNHRLQVFATPDTIAMASMSHVRVAWMYVVARGVMRRQLLPGPARAVKRTRGTPPPFLDHHVGV